MSRYRSFLCDFIIFLAVLVGVTNAQDCSCSPTAFIFTLDFGLLCPGTLEENGGIEETSCIVTVISAESDDFIPVQVTRVDVLELSLDSVIRQTGIPGPFVDGDSFTYDAVSDELATGLQLTLTGENEAGITVINTWAVQYTNDCDFAPIYQDGDTIGWCIFADTAPADPQFCPAAPPTTGVPAVEPTPAPSAEQEPTLAPSVEETEAPTLAPSVEQEPTPAPSVEETEAPTPAPSVQEEPTPSPSVIVETEAPTPAPSVQEEPTPAPSAITDEPVQEEPTPAPSAITDEPVQEEPTPAPSAITDEPVQEEPTPAPSAITDEPVQEEPTPAPSAITDEPVGEEPTIEPTEDEPLGPEPTSRPSEDEPTLDPQETAEPTDDFMSLPFRAPLLQYEDFEHFTSISKHVKKSSLNEPRVWGRDDSYGWG